jgi:HSP20 family protein
VQERAIMMIRSNRPFVPPTDVIELVDRLLVVVEIAGMKTEDFNIMLQNRRLVISGTRARQLLKQSAYHQVEIGYGDFRVDLNLPFSADPEAVSAIYQHGFLQIELPRRPAERVNVVNLSDADQEENTHE